MLDSDLNVYRLIGIDPGNNLGVSIYSIDSNTNNICNIETRTYVLDRILNDNARMLDKLNLLSDIISNLYYVYQPLAVAMESAFMNVRFPTAVMALSQYVATIELTLVKCSSFTKIIKYPPKYIKGLISTGDANKQDMSVGISKVDELNRLLNFESMSEHEIDATAIAYILLQEIRKYPLMLYCIP